MILLQSQFILAGVFVLVFYAMGKEEAKSGRRDNGVFWAGLSTAISGLVIGVFDAGWGLVVVVNVLLFVLIGVFRLLRDRN